MRVTLFRDMGAENWYSMDRYADSLSRQFKTPSTSQDFEFQSFVTEPPVRFSRAVRFWRNRVYPNFARFNQGAVNHILDHSYSHLLNYLDMQRTVVTCHDLIPLKYEDNSSVLEVFRGIINNLRKSRRVIAISESTKTDLVNELGIDVSRIVVIYSGVDPIFHHLDKGGAKRKYKEKFGLPEGQIVLNFGSNLKYKNVEMVLRAFKDIIVNNPFTHLLRIHPLTSEQRKLAQDLGILSNYLEVLDPNDEDLVGLYNCGDVLLSPSLKEGFGLHVLEALACGTPVVVSRNTSLQEIVGDEGVLVDPNDASDIAAKTLAILNDDIPVNSDRLIERSALFNWKKTAEKVMQVYRDIASGL
jgi:glycosyltransferase involved in cell wall biosynthesis